jgi:phospholipid-binding lipoprotein MlaA
VKTKITLLNILGLCFSFCLFCSQSINAQPHSRPVPRIEIDPFEKMNRSALQMNLTLDRYVFRPIATFYADLVPGFLQTNVSNFFSNLEDPAATINDVLQGNIYYAYNDFARFFFNSTFGIAGIFDVATKMGIPKREQDFGLTLAKWGYRNPPYLVIPVLGPSTTRDVLRYPTDFYAFSIWPYFRAAWVTYGLYGLWVVEYRASLLPANKLVDQAFDPYVFVRDAYLQRRDYLIQTYVDNDQPMDSSEEEDEDELVSEDSE